MPGKGTVVSVRAVSQLSFDGGNPNVTESAIDH